MGKFCCLQYGLGKRNVVLQSVNYGAPLANLGFFWNYRGKNWDLGIPTYLNLGLQKWGLYLGLWDFTLSHFGITTVQNWDYAMGNKFYVLCQLTRFFFQGFVLCSLVPFGLFLDRKCRIYFEWPYGITPYLKFGFRDYTLFKLGFWGLLTVPNRALTLFLSVHIARHQHQG